MLFAHLYVGMGANYVCPRCGNSDPRYIGTKSKVKYCRRCLIFQGEEVKRAEGAPKPVSLSIPYRLSKEQKELSERILANYKQGKDTLVYAVCGSGKTEISFGVIGFAMSEGHKVAFALPRRDVVIELSSRLAEAFPTNRIVAVYGGHNEELEGDCIVLTTHQLYRYPDYFDLIVMDEVDAFPFKGSELLEAMLKRSLRGRLVMMSATPSKELVAQFRKPGKDLVTLHTRFHKKPIPVPKLVVGPGPYLLLSLLRLLRRYHKEGKQCFIFVPTVALSEDLHRKTSLFCPKGNYVSSKREKRAKIIADFKKGRYSYLVTTAVLERGITVRNLQVIVYLADESIYDAAALIQIAGRAGRKKDAPFGEVTFLARKETKGIDDAIIEIKRCNAFLPKVLQKA